MIVLINTVGVRCMCNKSGNGVLCLKGEKQMLRRSVKHFNIFCSFSLQKHIITILIWMAACSSFPPSENKDLPSPSVLITNLAWLPFKNMKIVPHTHMFILHFLMPQEAFAGHYICCMLFRFALLLFCILHLENLLFEFPNIRGVSSYLGLTANT